MGNLPVVFLITDTWYTKKVTLRPKQKTRKAIDMIKTQKISSGKIIREIESVKTANNICIPVRYGHSENKLVKVSPTFDHRNFSKVPFCLLPL